MDAEIECRREFYKWWDGGGCDLTTDTEERAYRLWAEAWLKSAEASLAEIQKILRRKL